MTLLRFSCIIAALFVVVLECWCSLDALILHSRPNILSFILTSKQLLYLCIFYHIPSIFTHLNMSYVCSYIFLCFKEFHDIKMLSWQLQPVFFHLNMLIHLICHLLRFLSLISMLTCHLCVFACLVLVHLNAHYVLFMSFLSRCMPVCWKSDF